MSSQRAVGVDVNIAALWSYGLGDARTWAVSLTTVMRKLDQRAGLFFAMFFANMFQVVVSALYPLYNNLITVMVVASEWNGFVSERKTLRLSRPQGIILVSAIIIVGSCFKYKPKRSREYGSTPPYPIPLVST
jgi:hypothetical protein